MLKDRKALNKKPKVDPVMGSQVKMDKLLKKQMASMTIGGKAPAKQAADSSDEGDDEEMNNDIVKQVPRSIRTKKHIKKAGGISRAEELALKK